LRWRKPPEGSITLKVNVQIEPSARVAFTVEEPALSPAVKAVAGADGGDTEPPPMLTDQVTDSAGMILTITSSPTPTFVRVRSFGTSARVLEVSVHP